MASPIERTRFSAVYRGAATTFRIVQDDSATRGSYTIETLSRDARGADSWSTLVQVTSSTDDRQQTRLTAKVLASLLDAVYR